jgi:hypothetical protein
MIHCADRANAQRIRMPDAVRAELFVTPIDLEPMLMSSWKKF